MPNINWEMMTQFIFPESVGIAEEVVSVTITPRWQKFETEESIRLNGIYHITATVRLNPEIQPVYREGTLIEHLDLNGDEGYFEYAMPLEVDLPREKVALGNEPELSVENISFFVYDGSCCTFKWDVLCHFEEPVEGALFHVNREEESVSIDQVQSFEEVTLQPKQSSKEWETEKEPDVPVKVAVKEPPLREIERNLASEALQHTELESTSFGPHIQIQPVKNSRYVREASIIRKEVEGSIEKTKPLKKQQEYTVEEKWTEPSDTDDFYNELSESYTLLKFK